MIVQLNTSQFPNELKEKYGGFVKVFVFRRFCIDFLLKRKVFRLCLLIFDLRILKIVRRETTDPYFRKSDVYNSEMVEKMPFAQSLILNPKDKQKGNVIQLFNCLEYDDCKKKGRLKVYEDWLQNYTFGGSNPVFFRHIVDDVCC